MPVTHIVAFKFPPSTSKGIADDLLEEFLALKSHCLNDGKGYIVDIIGGRNMSIEGMGKDYDFAVVVSFASKEDRDYYVKEDPVHAEFAKKAKATIADAFIFDFET